MLPTPENYAIYPATVLADQRTELRILATERAFLPFDGETYTLTVVSIDADEDYYHPEKHETLTVTARDGAITFSHTFRGEQEHLLLLSRGETKLASLYVYSLRADLYALRPLRGDLHGHSFRSDGKRDPAALAGHYREMGYDFFALTDHNRYYPGGEIDETYRGLSLGITRVLGEEVHSPGSVLHIVHVGGSRSVAEEYQTGREEYEKRIAEYQTRVPSEIPTVYRERYAKAMWATDAIHAAGGLAIFPHPYWKPGTSKCHNVCDEFARILLKSGMFDAFELLGGATQAECNRQVALWGDLRAEGLKIPVVGSSDVHSIAFSESFPHRFTVCFATENENGAILRAVKDGYSVAVEATGDEYERRYFCYGSLRLVSYAQFLLQNYFPKTERLAAGEGVAMRAYAVEGAAGELVELSAKATRDFSDRYLGRTAAALPSAELRDFEDRWRARHLAGPITKGSAVDAKVANRQI